MKVTLQCPINDLVCVIQPHQSQSCNVWTYYSKLNSLVQLKKNLDYDRNRQTLLNESKYEDNHVENFRKTMRGAVGIEMFNNFLYP